MIKPKIEIITSKPENYSILVKRGVEVKLKDLIIKLLVEIFIFQDDDGNFKLEPEIIEITYLINKGRKITNTNSITENLKNYDKDNKINVFTMVDSHISKYFKKLKNQQVKDLAKEYSITL
jgi:hypothetical protein